MRATQWKQLQIEWTWAEVAWILAHGGGLALEHVIAYARDVRDLAENPTPPLVAWAVDKWPKDREGKPGDKAKRPIEL